MRKKTVYAVTDDDTVFRKIELLLRHECHIVRCNGECPANECVIFDIDSARIPVPDRAILLSRNSITPEVLPIPFSLSALRERVLSDERPIPRLSLIYGSRAVRLGEKEIKLTDVEYKLISELIEARGYVSREYLLNKVWCGGTDPGVVNVYVHYLRRKLEGEGDKIFCSSRQLGYKIDERFLEA